MAALGGGGGSWCSDCCGTNVTTTHSTFCTSTDTESFTVYTIFSIPRNYKVIKLKNGDRQLADVNDWCEDIRLRAMTDLGFL